MKLEDYRLLRRMTRAAVAEALGVREVTVYRWERQRRTPPPDLIRKIREWSAGAVTADDLVSQPEPAAS